MGFYTYSVTSRPNATVFNDFVAWLNTNGVECVGVDTTGNITINNFNGMNGSFILANLWSTSITTAYVFKFTLVTEPGKELIAVQGTATNQPGTSTSHFAVFGLILNRNGSLYATNRWCSSFSFAQAEFTVLPGSVIKDATADNYIIPLMMCPSGEDYAFVIFENYYLSFNLVEVSPGVVISDGTKQFISCGLFLFVEYDPATMSE